MILTCAVSATQFPRTTSEYPDEARRAQDAGASVIQVLPRQADGAPSYEVDDALADIDAVRTATPDVVVSLGAGTGLGLLEQRLACLERARPDIAAICMGPSDAQPLPASDPFKSIVALLTTTGRLSIRAEHQCFDSGHVARLDPLLDLDVLDSPLLISMVVVKVAPALAAGCTIVVEVQRGGAADRARARGRRASDRPPAGRAQCGDRFRAGDRRAARRPSGRRCGVLHGIGGGRGPRRGRRGAGDQADALELGGKSANVVLDDADLAVAVKVGAANAFLNAGQTCTAWTRLVVPSAVHDEACELAGALVAAYQLGNPADPGTRLGPLVSAAQRERVRGYIRRGLDEGCRLVTDGPEAPDDLEHGYYVRPTVFGEVDPDATVAREEIFGPVLSILRHEGDHGAVRIANHSDYGLHGAVWSQDEDRALAVARRLRTGTVDINGAPYNPLAPFGGYKKSGVGREMGPYGLDDYEEIKAVQLP